ncbi:tyrosine-type recombinase/integrase [Candidatus Methanarcanum hacksteinii]|uniref:tyrosine-type recombinase/integrase n=1 Tax=Candidatus Methanarcanum hacksteinii TaxID=2911857 RepID=UPI0037DD8C38
MMEHSKLDGIKNVDKDYVVQFIKHIRKLNLAPDTKYAYEQSVNRCLTFLSEGKRNTHPKKINQDDIMYLKNVGMGALSERTKLYYFTAFSTYLEFYSNNVIRNMHIHWGADERTHVDWLEPQDAKKLLDAPLNLAQQLVIQLELCMGLRRVEVIRLTTDKIFSDRADIRGKGRGGGKWRSVPMSPQTKEVLNQYLVYRDNMIAEAKKRNPGTVVPKEVLLHLNGSYLGAYSEHGTGFDKAFVEPVRKITGVHFGNHTLRRTFGRQLWKNGIPIETIAKILGHESVSMTLRYIGVNIGDMSSAINGLSFE